MGMTSFGRQFDFYDVIYHIRPCKVDNRQRNVGFYYYRAFKTYVKIHVSVQTRVKGNSNSLFKMAESL